MDQEPVGTYPWPGNGSQWRSPAVAHGDRVSVEGRLARLEARLEDLARRVTEDGAATVARVEQLLLTHLGAATMRLETTVEEGAAEVRAALQRGDEVAQNAREVLGRLRSGAAALDESLPEIHAGLRDVVEELTAFGAEVRERIDVVSRCRPAESTPDARGDTVSREVPTMAAALTDVQGVGPARLAALEERFGTLSQLAAASVEEVAAVRGISDDLAVRILAAAASAVDIPL